MAVPEKFRCFFVNKDAAGVRGEVTERPVGELPAGNVVVRVAYSSLNYKDALSATGNPGVTRKFPHVPGIDAAGVIETSDDPRLRPGTEVLVTGHDLGQNTWGGMAEFIRVPAEWVLPLPVGLSPREAMAYGTAGLTAAQCVEALRHGGITPDRGEVVVTGASGGVGSLAVGILATLGYRVAAVSGKPAAAELLTKLGAKTILSRQDVNDASNKPLLAVRFAAAIDTVGGSTLATLLRSVDRHGVVAACGLVGGAELNTTVFPFILRGVTLAGIDSVECPRPQRERIWSSLATGWRVPLLDELTREIALEEVPAAVQTILKGEIVGRTIVRPGRD